MNIINANPYSGYSQPKSQIFQYDEGQKQQVNSAAAETVRGKLQDRVSLSGVGENLLGFFMAGDGKLPAGSLDLQLERERFGIAQRLQQLFAAQGIADRPSLQIREQMTDDGEKIRVAGEASEATRVKLAEALNQDSDFRQQFKAAEQFKRLSESVATAKLRMETLTQDGAVPQYQELQKIKEQVERLFFSIDLSGEGLDFRLID